MGLSVAVVTTASVVSRTAATILQVVSQND